MTDYLSCLHLIILLPDRNCSVYAMIVIHLLGSHDRDLHALHRHYLHLAGAVFEDADGNEVIA